MTLPEANTDMDIQWPESSQKGGKGSTAVIRPQPMKPDQASGNPNEAAGVSFQPINSSVSIVPFRHSAAPSSSLIPVSGKCSAHCTQGYGILFLSEAQTAVCFVSQCVYFHQISSPVLLLITVHVFGCRSSDGPLHPSIRSPHRPGKRPAGSYLRWDSR